MSNKFDPAKDVDKVAPFSLDQIAELFDTKRPQILAKTPTFEQIFETVILNELTTIPSLKAEFPKAGITKKLGTGLSLQTRVELLQHFRPAVEKAAHKLSDNKPLSQPEQCAQLEEELKLPDSLRMAEERLRNSRVSPVRRGNRTRAP
jgi:hypothetical protein